MEFIADQITDLKEGERLVIIPDHQLVYRADANNHLSITLESLDSKLEKLIGAIVYFVTKTNGSINLKVGSIRVH